MSETPRCEPPPELQDRDGWHWVQEPIGEPHLARWHAAERDDVEPLWTSTHHVYSGTPRYATREWGWRYLSPVATSAEVAALRAERDAAVFARDAYGRDLDQVAAERDNLRVEVERLNVTLHAVVNADNGHIARKIAENALEAKP